MLVSTSRTLRPIPPLNIGLARRTDSSSRRCLAVDALVMPVLADRYSSAQQAAPRILHLSNGFHMAGILTEPVPAQMVDNQSLGDNTSSGFPGEPVCAEGQPPDVEFAVAVRVPSAAPGPAIISVQHSDPAPEILGTVLKDNVIRADAKSFPANGGDPFMSPNCSSKFSLKNRPLRVPAFVPMRGFPGSNSARPNDAGSHIKMIPRIMTAERGRR